MKRQVGRKGLPIPKVIIYYEFFYDLFVLFESQFMNPSICFIDSVALSLRTEHLIEKENKTPKESVQLAGEKTSKIDGDKSEQPNNNMEGGSKEARAEGEKSEQLIDETVSGSKEASNNKSNYIIIMIQFSHSKQNS